MRWNVVIGGQLFSKSFLGYTSYKVGFATREGLLPAIALMLLPFVIFVVLVKLLPPWQEQGGLRCSHQEGCATGVSEPLRSAIAAIEERLRDRNALAACAKSSARAGCGQRPARARPDAEPNSCRHSAGRCWAWRARICCAP